MYFGITEKQTTDCISLYNNAGLISKVYDEIASENAETSARFISIDKVRATRTTVAIEIGSCIRAVD